MAHHDFHLFTLVSYPVPVLLSMYISTTGGLFDVYFCFSLPLLQPARVKFYKPSSLMMCNK